MALAALRAVGKLVLAVVLAYAGLMLASLAGGFIAGFLGALFQLSSETVASSGWAFPKVIFVAILVSLYVWEKRKKATGRQSLSKRFGP